MSKRPKKRIYHIILVSNGKQIKTMYNCASEMLINKKFDELIKDNKKVRFPVRYINIGKLVDAHYEIFIIKRNDNDKKETKLKDENGKIINFQTNDENWVVYDRADYEKEESFWVYGYHPVFQRKDFAWIYDNMISNNASKENIKQILVFRNKLLISTTYDLNMVMCKNESDCIRLYNELEREIEKNKIKYVYFTGDAYHSYLKKTWFKKIQDLTGWNETKIRRRNLRP
jgi:hypothetical protein